MRKIIAIVGDAQIEKDGPKYKMAFEMGKTLVDNGYRVQSGGMGGVMEAAFLGAKSSKNYKEGDTIALLPSFNHKEVNPYADIVIPTGLDVMRNALVANAKCVIAIGGGAGTLSEIAFAWSLKRMIIAFKNVDGWSSKVADTKMDHRVRYNFEDKVFGVESAKEAIDIINKKLDLYDKHHEGIELL